MNQLKRKKSNGGGISKRQANMFADSTGMTSVILDLIATETETPKNMTNCGGVGMTQASVPEIDASGESNRCGGGG